MLNLFSHCNKPAWEGCASPILGASLSQYETNVSIDTLLLLGWMFISTIACSTPRARSWYLSGGQFDTGERDRMKGGLIFFPQGIVVVLTTKTVQISPQHLNTSYIRTDPTDAGDNGRKLKETQPRNKIRSRFQDHHQGHFWFKLPVFLEVFLPGSRQPGSIPSALPPHEDTRKTETNCMIPTCTRYTPRHK